MSSSLCTKTITPVLQGAYIHRVRTQPSKLGARSLQIVRPPIRQHDLGHTDISLNERIYSGPPTWRRSVGFGPTGAKNFSTCLPSGVVPDEATRVLKASVRVVADVAVDKQVSYFARLRAKPDSSTRSDDCSSENLKTHIYCGATVVRAKPEKFVMERFFVREKRGPKDNTHTHTGGLLCIH